MESREVGFGGGAGGGSSCGIASSSASAAEASACGTKMTLLHFDTTSTSNTSAAHTLFFGSSPAEGMSNGRGAAFTLVQREELERQTMIFKYMMASVPVPPQLLLPLTKNQRSTVHSCSSSAATDSEPWRCRRTDGKKWRCSRDVAPHQKYCERHSHKNRPRSRKPVESSVNSITTNRLHQISNSRNNSSSVTAVSSAVICQQDSSHHHYLSVNTQQQQQQRDFSHASAPPSPRCLEWFTRGEVIAVPNSDQDWHHQHTKDLYHLKQHSHVPPLSPYPDQAEAGCGDVLNDQCSLLLGLPSSLEGTFNINGTDDLDKASPCSLLSLAVFSDHVAQEEDCTNGKREGDSKPHWMSSGGPLAEALCLGSSGLGKSGTTDGRN